MWSWRFDLTITVKFSGDLLNCCFYILVLQCNLPTGNQYLTLIKIRHFVVFLHNRRQPGMFRNQFGNQGSSWRIYLRRGEGVNVVVDFNWQIWHFSIKITNDDQADKANIQWWGCGKWRPLLCRFLYKKATFFHEAAPHFLPVIVFLAFPFRMQHFKPK